MQKVEEYYRYCPGEELMKLSDAVCLARRRRRYPKCSGCQFNDDEQSSAAGAEGTAADSGASRIEATQREQVAALFAGDALRGTVPTTLDEEVAWRVGHAAAQFLRAELRGYDRSRPEKSAVVVGRDMRKSSPALAEALIEGLCCGGSPVIDIGMIDTPQLYFAVRHVTCCGGVQVTAGEAGADRNGFVICGQKGRPVGPDTGLAKIGKIAENTSRHTSPQPAGRERTDLADAYKTFVRGFLREPAANFSADRPLKLVVDASNGMAGRWVPIVFGDVDWLEIVRLNFEHNGQFVHDPDPQVEANLAQLQDRMMRAKAHAGVCFNGDANACAWFDEQSQRVPADLMAALLARHLLAEVPAATVVHDVCCSRVLGEEVHKAGGTARRERCGHAYVKKSLADARGLFAAEVAGRCYFRDNGYCESGMITIATVLNVLTGSGRRLSESIDPLRRYAYLGPRAYPCEQPGKVQRRLVDKHGDAEIDRLDGLTVRDKAWWFNVRPDAAEPILWLTLEANDAETLDRKLADVERLIVPAAKRAASGRR